MNVFSHVLLRTSALPASTLECLRAPKSFRLAGRIATLDRALAALRESLGAVLFERIGHAGPDVRGVLIRLRRDVFNDRSISEERLRSMLDDDTSALLDRYIRVRAIGTRLRERGEVTLAAEISAARHALRRLAVHPAIESGLNLASTSLLHSLRTFYAVRDPRSFTARDRDTESGLVRYLSRIVMKPTPFSTFAHVAAGTLAPHARDPVEIDGGGLTWDVRSHAALNSRIFGLLVDRLTCIRPALEQLPLTLNPTITAGEESFEWLAEINGAEVLQRMARTVGVDIVVALTETALEGIAYGTLASRLRRDRRLRVTRKESADYLDRLLSIGFLEVVLPISANDPRWPEQFSAFLKHLSSRAGSVLAIDRILCRMRQLTEDYTQSDVRTRSGVLDELSRSYQELAAAPAAAERSFSLAKERLIYEDTVLAASVRIDGAVVQRAVTALDRILAPLRDLDGDPDRDALAAFCRQHVSREAGVPLIRLYEAFRTERRVDLENAVDASARRALLERIAAQAVFDAGEVHLATAPLREAAADERRPPVPSSFSCFLQFVEASEPKAVLNAIAPGFGKMYSRFLRFLDPAMTADLRTWNAAVICDAMPVQNCDSALSNANAHPALLPFEMRLPGSHNTVPPERQVRVSDLLVRLTGDDTVELRHRRTGERILVLDLGLQAPGARTPLYRFLTLFEIGPARGLRSLIALLNARTGTTGDIVVRPRIVLDDVLVIQRRGWIAPIRLIPRPARGDSEWSWFANLNAWRVAARVPEMVFVRPLLAGLHAARETALPQSVRVLHKPQYLSFDSPALLGLFRQLLQSGAESLLFEEALPAAHEFYPLAGERRAWELLVQWA